MENNNNQINTNQPIITSKPIKKNKGKKLALIIGIPLAILAFLSYFIIVPQALAMRYNSTINQNIDQTFELNKELQALSVTIGSLEDETALNETQVKLQTILNNYISLLGKIQAEDKTLFVTMPGAINFGAYANMNKGHTAISRDIEEIKNGTIQMVSGMKFIDEYSKSIVGFSKAYEKFGSQEYGNPSALSQGLGTLIADIQAQKDTYSAKSIDELFEADKNIAIAQFETAIGNLTLIKKSLDNGNYASAEKQLAAMEIDATKIVEAYGIAIEKFAKSADQLQSTTISAILSN